MVDLTSIPFAAAILFFFAGIIFGSLFRSQAKRLSPETSFYAQRLNRAKYAWRARKRQCNELADVRGRLVQLQADIDRKSVELLSSQTNCDSLKSSLSQLEYDYLEQKERLHRQIRRNRMLNAQLSEVIEAKAAVISLKGNVKPEKNAELKNTAMENHRFPEEVSTQPIIFSDRVKLRVPRKVNEGR